MKKILLSTVLLSAMAVPVAAKGLPLFRAGQNASPEMKKQMEMVRKVNAAAEKGLWLPGMIVNFEWDDEVWIETTVQNCSYNPDGSPSEVNMDGIIMRYSYDELGRVVKLTGSQESDPDTELIVYSFTYDSVVADAIVRADMEVSAGGMTMTQTSGVDVVRNADGNVTQVTEYNVSPFAGREDGAVVKIEYGSDGKACRIDILSDEDDYLVPLVMKDIVWERTDGQILRVGFNESDPGDGLFGADNLLKSAVVYDKEEDVETLYECTYSEDGYEMVDKIGDTVVSRFQYMRVDEYGSYEYKIHDVFYDVLPDGQISADDEMTFEKYHTVDGYGLVLEDTELEYEGEDSAFADVYSLVGHVEYNSEYGYPEEYWSEQGESGMLDKDKRVLYSEYELYGAGVEGVESAEEAEPAYFNMQGMRVANPGTGIYIERVGGSTRKVAR